MHDSGRPDPLSRLRDRRVLFLLHAVLVVALALWVRTLNAPVGAVAALSAFGAASVTWRAKRVLATVALALIALATSVFVGAHVGATRAARFEALRTDDERAAPFERELADAIRAAQIKLKAAADSAVIGRHPDRDLPALPSDAGTVVYVPDERAKSWAGKVTVPTTRLYDLAGVVVTPLYVVQYAASATAGLRAVSTNIVSALPPADRLARTLARDVGDRSGVSFDVVAGPATDAFGGTTVDLGASRISILARVPDAPALLARVDEDARTRGTILLVIATMIALSIWWRRAERLPERLLATSLPLAALAITPLNRLSNVTRLFDPATYYAPIGGPFTASIGALALTSALVLFAVLAGLRDRAQPRRRWAPALAVVAIAFGGPFLFGDLARGVSLPPNGASTALWLAWQVALFLAATSLLAAGVTAGQWALGARRGLPLWIAPTLAAAAAVLGPLELTGSARWPVWYPYVWVAAIAALALSRRSRAVLFPSAMVAACGVTVLLWGVTLRERTGLATDDVARLATIDSSTASLVRRFADDLAASDVPSTPEALLARYAAADLSAVNYPLALGHWPPIGAPVVVRLGGESRDNELAQLAFEARIKDSTLIRVLPPAPAATLMLAVPHADSTVTTAIIGARTRLTRPLAFAELLGFTSGAGQPPYELIHMGAIDPRDTTRTPWEIRGNHLHADWSLPAGTGRVRVNANVPIDAYETLYPRGLLVVLFDLFVVGLLLAVDLLADGALIRWIRTRRAEWARSYRLKLTLALFAFFVVPALVFAAWSYRRLQVDDRAARELLLRESLRRATAISGAGGSVTQIVNVPDDVPFFVYRGGELTMASNPLYLGVAPTGLWLPENVKQMVNDGEDLIATAGIDVGARQTLFGFRALTVPQPQIVAAVPARRDDAALDKRRSDLGVLVGLATVLGALAALGLSGIAARQLARPIGTLSGAAIAVAGGSRAPLDSTDAPSEFLPVFRAFDKMARELAESETQLSRAERVFAWGEMARQVAHEIKNPLTPIRLGVQHLLRAWHDARPDFGSILEENSARVLREIDHLDATARSFSQYGTAPDPPAAAGSIDVAAVVRDVASLETLGVDGLQWTTAGVDAPTWARARTDELREVLLNLCENARLAGARRVDLRVEPGERVAIRVVDDGEGVAPEARARVFEPHFSTRTSGSGLGLAISRRLVEGWGATISLTSAHGVGTTVELRLQPADPPA